MWYNNIRLIFTEETIIMFGNAPKTKQVHSKLRDLLIQGDYAEGKPLPAERELALKFGVSRITIRNAMSILEEDGIIQKFHGRASIVNIIDSKQRNNNEIDSGIILYVMINTNKIQDTMGFSFADVPKIEEAEIMASKEFVEGLAKMGHCVMPAFTNPKDLALGKLPMGHQLDNISAYILTGSVEDYHIEIFQKLGRPVIVFGNNNINIPVSQIRYNLSKASYSTAKALYEVKKGQVIFVSAPLDTYPAYEAAAGYVTACNDLNIETTILMQTYLVDNSSKEQLKRILKSFENEEWSLLTYFNDGQMISDCYNELGLPFSDHPAVILVTGRWRASKEVLEKINYSFEADVTLPESLLSLIEDMLNGNEPRIVSYEPELKYQVVDGKLQIDSKWVPETKKFT